MDNPTGLIPDMNIASIKPVLEEVGFEVTEEDFGGTPTLAINYEGKKAFLQPSACGDVKCLGLAMTAMLNSAVPATQEQVTEFNVNMNAGNAVLTGGAAVSQGLCHC